MIVDRSYVARTTGARERLKSVVNDAARPGWLAIPGNAAAEAALAEARLTDERMARVRDDLVTVIVGAGRLRAIDRSVHRHEHLDQIERALPAH